MSRCPRLPRKYLHALWRRVVGGRQIVDSRMRTRPRDYDELARMLDDGGVRPTIDHVYPLSESREAFAALERGGVRGKIVLRMR